MERTKPRQEKPAKQYSKTWLKEHLSHRHKQFIHEYISNGWNATKAYMIAYPGSNAKNASEAGCKLLKMSKISQYLDNTKEDYETICGVSKARQVREYSKIAYSRISNLHNSWISLKDWDELLEEDPTCMDAVESIDRKLIKRMDDFQNLIEVEYVKIKLHNKIAALQSIDNLMGYKQAEKIDMSSKVTSSVDVTNYTDEEKKVLLKLARKQEYKD